MALSPSMGRILCLLDMPLVHAHHVGMQYTLRNVPAALDRELRRRAKRDGRSLNQVALGLLREALGLAETPQRRRHLGDLVGTWKDDPEFDRAIADQHAIDGELWR